MVVETINNTMATVNNANKGDEVMRGAKVFNLEENRMEMKKLLEEYDYNVSDNGIDTIVNKWWNKKTNLRNIFRKHPNWDEEQQAIIYDATEYETGINKDLINEFLTWFTDNMFKTIGEKEGFRFDRNEYDAVTRNFQNIKDIIRYNREEVFGDAYPLLVERYYDLREDYKRLRDIYNKNCYYQVDDGIYLNEEQYKLVDKLNRIIRNIESSNADQEFVNAINDLGLDINVSVGQKISRIVNKICVYFGLDKIVNVQKIYRNGEYIDKNYGYNYYFAKLGDAINPIIIKKYTVISILDLDYYTMSFLAHKKATCHTIDKKNKRGCEHSYSGCYSSGTESYMFDPSTVIFYTVDENYNGKMWKADKDRRMNFHINEDGEFFIFGRLYPDGRDGGEKGLAAQFRNVVQRVLTECLGFNNLWKVIKGTVPCEFVNDEYSTHYPDYFKYEDCGYSFLKDRIKEFPRIRIGSLPICPKCGREHEEEEWITCSDCRDNEERTVLCNRCGARIHLDNDDYVLDVDTDHYYCDSDCASNYGVEYCEDDGSYHSQDTVYCEDDCAYHFVDNCLHDDYDNNWYFRCDNEVIVNCRNGATLVFVSEENAIAYGCVYDEETGTWKYND